MDHNGRFAGSRSMSRSDATASRATTSPGAGHTTVRTWCSMAKSSSSVQNGRPQPNGASTSTCRSRGMARLRRSTASVIASGRSRSLGPSTSTAPTCIGAGPASVARSIRSFALARSIATFTR